MIESATDWQGRLRIGDLIRDALRLVMRQPGAGVLVPAAIVCAVLFATDHLDFELDVLRAIDRGRGSNYWLGSYGLLVAPLMSPCWLALAWGEDAQTHSWRERAKQAAQATALMAALGLGFGLGGPLSTLAAIVITMLVALAVPVLACEPVGLARSIRRSVELGKGTRVSVIAAWVVLQLIAAVAMVVVVTVIALVPELSADFPDEALELVGLAFIVGFAGLRWGLTMAVCVAAYRRLSHARAALDPEAWLEVFR